MRKNEHFGDYHTHHEISPSTSSLKFWWHYYRGWKWLIFMGLSLALLLSSYLVFIAKATDVKTLQSALQYETVVYDKNDQEAGTLLSQKGTYVPLAQISDSMRQTVVATEDKRFYEHGGFDTMGMGRALVRLLVNRDTSGGGGSTITQQLAKNAFLSADQTLQRKLKELFLALEIEKAYEKDQILEMYLNNAYFGNGVWGIEDASLKYFGHSADTLDWNESMVLTGMLKGPSLFNPIDDYQAAVERRKVIAQLLFDQGIISAQTQAEINESAIQLFDAYVWEHKGHEYPAYFDGLINEAVRLTKIPEEDLMAKGYKIYTNLDIQAQAALDQSYIDNAVVFNDGAMDGAVIQSASAVIDPKTGGISAVYGGRGDYVYRGFNRATDMYRAPGSVIKPMAIYLPALESGMTPQTIVPDVVQAYGPEQYTPENYNHYTEPSGETALYYALAQSKNTAAVYLLDKLGIEIAVKKLQQFGIKVPDQDQKLPLALGALSRGTSPVQIASAYAAFANNGVRRDSYFIRRIEDASGKKVYRNENPRKHMVMTKKLAKEMTSMMLDTYGEYGTGYGAGPDNGLIAGKTGSTEVTDGSTQTRDRWMVGYTPDYVVATWVGLDDVGSGNLDEIMPTGLGQVFKSQNTYLMANSSQTPFDVTFASQAESQTSPIGSGWLDDLGQGWQDLTDQAGAWLEDMGQSLSEWFSQVQEMLG